jgi:serine/threonine protein kinase
MVDGRQHRQIITEYLPYCIADQELSVVEALQVWRSLYLIVDSIAQKGWVHRDLSWNNIRLVRGEKSLSVMLIDFDLASRISGDAICPPDTAGTLAFMPIDILGAGKKSPRRHQELHEDEAVFWVGFLGLISRSSEGREWYDYLLRRDMRTLAGLKTSMLTFGFCRQYFPVWFSNTAEMNILKDTLTEIIQRQFGDRSWAINYVYPPPDKWILRKHPIQHRKVLGDVIEQLDEAIQQLKFLEGKTFTSTDV